MNRGIREQVWFVPKQTRGFMGGDSSASSGKLWNFYPNLSYTCKHSLHKTLVPQNCFIMNIGSPTHHICPAWKTILRIWQNVKARELQKSARYTQTQKIFSKRRLKFINHGNCSCYKQFENKTFWKKNRIRKERKKESYKYIAGIFFLKKNRKQILMLNLFWKLYLLIMLSFSVILP